MFTSDIAEQSGGTFLLRIEDTDFTRCKPQWEKEIMANLQALGLSWPQPVLRQSDRTAIYQAALETLKESDLIYPCFCTRRDIMAEIEQAGGAPHGPDGPHYPGTCRKHTRAEREARMANGESFAWRLNIAQAAKEVGPLSLTELGQADQPVVPETFGDVVIARKDISTSYHLACVIDDAAQGVTLVTRGADLKAACHIQRVLQDLLNLPTPRYAHHALVGDQNNKRLAKRDGDSGLSALIDAGLTPQQILDSALAALI